MKITAAITLRRAAAALFTAGILGAGFAPAALSVTPAAAAVTAAAPAAAAASAAANGAGPDMYYT